MKSSDEKDIDVLQGHHRTRSQNNLIHPDNNVVKVPPIKRRIPHPSGGEGSVGVNLKGFTDQYADSFNVNPVGEDKSMDKQQENQKTLAIL